MYFSKFALTARQATLEHYQSASRILLDSTDGLVNLYFDTGHAALGHARSSDSLPDNNLFHHVLPEFFTGYLRVAGRAQEGLVRLAEVQMHSASTLAKFTLDKTAHFSPPVVEQAVNATGAMVTAGENAADALCEASIKAIVGDKKTLDRPSRAKKKVVA